jgi:hypothetical protein
MDGTALCHRNGVDRGAVVAPRATPSTVNRMACVVIGTTAVR